MKNWILLFVSGYALLTTFLLFSGDEQKEEVSQSLTIRNEAGTTSESSSSAFSTAFGTADSGRADSMMQADHANSSSNAGQSGADPMLDDSSAHVATPREQNIDIPPENADEMIARELQQARQYMAQADTYLRNEEVDPAWSDQANSEINYLFSSAPQQQSSLLSVDCRSTLCKLEVMHNEKYDQESFEMDMAENFAQTMPRGTMIRDPARPNVSVIYMARKGHSLPPME